MTPRDRVEAFHLLFLRALVAQVAERGQIILKGGCNLRFYFGSPRFSEDMDLDVRTMAVPTLAKRVDAILVSVAFGRVLRANGLAIETWSAPKQTSTVQRWKVALANADGGLPEPTKLEFSRRRAGDGAVEPVLSSVLERLHLPSPIIASHYALGDAAKQKLDALIGRSEPQARDVFDLHWLISRGAALPAVSHERRKAAVERVMSFSRDDFEAHVIAYLEPDEQQNWTHPSATDALQLRVAEVLEP